MGSAMLDWSERLKVYFVKEQIDTVLNKESAVRLTHLQLHSQGLSPHCVFFLLVAKPRHKGGHSPTATTTTKKNH